MKSRILLVIVTLTKNTKKKLQNKQISGVRAVNCVFNLNDRLNPGDGILALENTGERSASCVMNRVSWCYTENVYIGQYKPADLGGGFRGCAIPAPENIC